MRTAPTCLRTLFPRWPTSPREGGDGVSSGARATRARFDGWGSTYRFCREPLRKWTMCSLYPVHRVAVAPRRSSGHFIGFPSDAEIVANYVRSFLAASVFLSGDGRHGVGLSFAALRQPHKQRPVSGCQRASGKPPPLPQRCRHGALPRARCGPGLCQPSAGSGTLFYGNHDLALAMNRKKLN